MKQTLVMALVAVLVCGCSKPPQQQAPADTEAKAADTIRIGMPLENARRILAANGATESGFDMMPPEGQELLGVELPGNRPLSIAYDLHGDNRIMSMSLCTNPEVVKGLQNWCPVDEIRVTTDTPRRVE
ncbi:MAG: hypothetical protein JW909_03805 [Planctomycetes bacterium]|nr:hypothetical protein [Planctomycetota bacterium]